MPDNENNQGSIPVALVTPPTETQPRDETTEGAREPVMAPATPGLPGIVVSGRPFREYADEAAVALAAISSAQQLFLRGDHLVSLIQDESGNPTTKIVGRHELALILSRAANFFRVNTAGQAHVPPPSDLVNSLLSRRDLEIQTLRGISRTPIIRPDGTVVSVAGWDATTGIFYQPTPDIAQASWQLDFSSRSVARALGAIEDVLGDFPFEDCSSKANAIALLLTPIVRPVIAGCVPLALLNGTNPGTGKSLLTSVMGLIATGVEASAEAAPQTEDEWRKKITSALKAERPFIVFDNLRGTLQTCALEAALTSALWSDRLLGTNDDLTIRPRATWVATGNNVALGTDLVRRCYQIRFVATSSTPWLDSSNRFRHPHLLAWVREHRPELLMALLTLAGSWFACGSPAAAVEPLGSFEDWTAVVGGILEHAGVQGFLANLRDMYDEASAAAGEWESLLRTVRAEFGANAFTRLSLWWPRWARRSAQIRQYGRRCPRSCPVRIAVH